jgi:hypothetical protein
MIAVHELRIGSRVWDGDNIRTVAGILQAATGEYVYLDGDGDARLLTEVKPVPLSRELIEACWFEESTDGFWYEHETVTLYPIYLMTINGKWDFSLTDPREVAHWNPIRFLHQLQNLHFALNGEELEMEF